MRPDEPKPEEVTQPTEDSRQPSSPHDLETRPATEGGSSGQSSGSRPSYRLRPRQSFGPYEISQPLGRGGMGEVYEAVQSQSGHRVALKLLSSELSWSKSQRMRFLREGTLAASINHPNSLYVYGTEEIDGIPVIAMELAPGGTIKQRIEEQGELPPAEAVDAVLQIAAGLQAAHAAGVLHRDIKPGNCFVDRDGSIEIGDFGLAISTSGPEMVHLTATGTFLGTPAFASPEQVRGDMLDLRSDIYSVGATLYYLLTGGSPFEGATGMKMMAAILENKPKPPASRRHRIPAGLVQVVLRCLEKNPSARPQSYEELRSILEPFSSRAPNPAPMSTRFVAGLVDHILLAILSSPLAFLFDVDPQRNVPLAAVGIILSWFYGGIPEGIWGATPGKRLMRIRVLTDRGNIPGIPRAFLRAVLFWSAYALINGAALLLAHTPLGNKPSLFTDLLLYLPALGLLVVFLTARRENGWLGIHDRFSRTRVVLEQRALIRDLAQAEAAPVPIDDTDGRIGPYRIPKASATAKPGEVIPGIDPTLQRSVWIRMASPDAPPLSETRRILSRPGRLRWLNGRRSPGESWDAFEAVAGRSLLDVARNRQTWSTVRYWLHDLAEEARHLSPEERSHGALSLDRVWIASSGNAVLLDFPALGRSLSEGTGSAEISSPEEERFGTFLRRVAAVALSGSPSIDRGAEEVFGPLPLHARELLRKLLEEPDRSPEKIASELSGQLQSRTTVSSRRRLGQLALATSPALVFTLFAIAGVIAGWVFIDRNNPDIDLFKDAFRRLQKIESGEEPSSAEMEKEKRALEIYIAGPLRHVPVRDSISILGREFKAITWAGARRERLDQLLEDYPNPSETEIAEAQEAIGELIEEASASRGLMRFVLRTGEITIGILIALLTIMLPLYLLFGLVFRGGLSHRLLGLALVRRDGTEASRFRSLYRSLVAWAPLLLCVALFLVRLYGKGAEVEGKEFRHLVGDFVRPVTEGGFESIAVALFIAGVIWTIARPMRGVHDRIAGTYVVPR